MAKWLKYTHRSVVTEMDPNGNEAQREVLTEMAVPDDEKGRALAEKEAYGEIVSYDDGQPDPVHPETNEASFDDMAEAIKEGVNEV